MKKIKDSILFGALLFCTANFTLRADSALACVAAPVLDEACTDGVCVDETERWEYLGECFSSDLDTSKFSQKIGKFLVEHSFGISLLAAVLGDILLSKTFSKGVEFVADSVANRLVKVENIGEDCSPLELDRIFSQGAANKVVYERVKDIIYLLVFPVIICAVSNKILQSVGKKLEDREGRCNQLLEDFVINWDRNKAQTPTSLQPVFEALSEDYKSNGNFTKVDDASAQKIVESIVATALILSSVK